jgi:hypothetical protein
MTIMWLSLIDQIDAVALLARGRAQMSISGQIGRQRIRRPTAGLMAFTIMGATPAAGRSCRP